MDLASVTRIRKRLRISTDALDEEITSNIESALLELKRVGIINGDMANALIFTCVEFYCKWKMGFEGDGGKYEDAFDKLRDALSLSGEYTDEANEQKTNNAE